MRILLAPVIVVLVAGCTAIPSITCGERIDSLLWTEPGLFDLLQGDDHDAAYWSGAILVLDEPEAYLGHVIAVEPGEEEDPYRIWISLAATTANVSRISIQGPRFASIPEMTEVAEALAGAVVAEGDAHARAARWVAWAVANETREYLDEEGTEPSLPEWGATVDGPFEFGPIVSRVTVPEFEGPPGQVDTPVGTVEVRLFFPTRTIYESEGNLVVDTRERVVWGGVRGAVDEETARIRAEAQFARWDLPRPTFAHLEAEREYCA